ncbi:hydroxysqualene dehydroxylase [Paenibacillus swuensis]|uniref:hydroxysqualene dehydroxylase n=1 Tax=Paenibacillus swuensis TaxID=1178515 RepID=UPI0008398AE3|nr:FAD-dependent oxidoreductase [Paenibacillus swuensis]
MSKQVIVVGSGLAGLTCAMDLLDEGFEVTVLEAGAIPGGRTSNWDENGMEVESGFHKYIGFYSELPKLLERAGINLGEMLTWETTLEIRLPDQEEEEGAVFGLAPGRSPFKAIAGVLGNNDFLSPSDKMSLIPFMSAGLKDYTDNPEELDRYTVAEYAQKHGVNPEAIRHILEPLTAGVLFLPPERYSALVFFGIFAPGVPGFYKMKIGAFNGGMYDVMIHPIIHAITARGGKLRTLSRVSELISDGNQVIGVRIGEEELLADHVVVATNMHGAKLLLAQQFSGHNWFEDFLEMPMMSDITVQVETSKRLMELDRTTFAPGTCIGSFTEQSQTTFKHVPGRLSFILTPPERFIDLSDEEVFSIFLQDAKRIGLNIEDVLLDYRVIRMKDHFHTVEPGHAWRRPAQKTPIPGLTLAGDYTYQAMFTTMEGAVISGHWAAEAITGKGKERKPRAENPNPDALTDHVVRAPDMLGRAAAESAPLDTPERFIGRKDG